MQRVRTDFGWLVLNVVVAGIVAGLVSFSVVNSQIPRVRQAVAPATQTPVAAVVTKAHYMATALDQLASQPTYSVFGNITADAARQLRAEAESDTSSPQATAVLGLLPQIDEALRTRDPLEMNRLAIQLRKL